MPIAQIFVTDAMLAEVDAEDRSGLVHYWAEHASDSGRAARAHMTVNIVPVTQQVGAPIPVLCQFFPSGYVATAEAVERW